MEENFGRIEIKLSKLLDEKKVTKNYLARKAELNWRQISKYYDNEITRMDVYVLCKICTALGCKIEDLLEFIPADKERA